MNKDLKKKWIDALRSGKYLQGQDRLCHKGAYCCLGVLGSILPKTIDFEICDFYEEGVVYVWDGEEYTECDEYLPLDIGKIIGLELPMQEKLARMNDNGKSFEEIADFIEENL